METGSVNLNVYTSAMSQAQSVGPLSTVIITQNVEFEEFIVNKFDDSVSSIRSYQSSPLPEISLKFLNFTPNYVYQLLHNRFHDTLLSRQISDQIVLEAQRCQNLDFPQRTLFMVVYVKLIQKVFNVVPSISRKETEVESESCAICLEFMSESGSETKPICQLPNCSHLFHEKCVVQWLDRHNSCPLCRQAV